MKEIFIEHAVREKKDARYYGEARRKLSAIGEKSSAE